MDDLPARLKALDREDRERLRAQLGVTKRTMYYYIEGRLPPRGYYTREILEAWFAEHHPAPWDSRPAVTAADMAEAWAYYSITHLPVHHPTISEAEAQFSYELGRLLKREGRA